MSRRREQAHAVVAHVSDSQQLSNHLLVVDTASIYCINLNVFPLRCRWLSAIDYVVLCKAWHASMAHSLRLPRFSHCTAWGCATLARAILK
jgi:hypothetical protein